MKNYFNQASENYFNPFYLDRFRKINNSHRNIKFGIVLALFLSEWLHFVRQVPPLILSVSARTPGHAHLAPLRDA